MRIQILSDLHLEFDAAIPPLAPGVDAVIVAGDPAQLSKTGDRLEVLDQVADFQQFREPLERAPGYVDGSKGSLRRMTQW